MKMIWVTFQRNGYHYFPRAKDDPSLADVSYLGSIHRHLFKFKISIEVFHEDREVEFHQFLNYIESLYESKTLSLNGKSCEMIADELCDWIGKKYQGRQLIIDVSEDGECGCSCEYKV